MAQGAIRPHRRRWPAFRGKPWRCRNFGFEAEASYASGPWRVDANLLINDPDIVRADPGFPLSGDRRLPGVADFTAGLNVTRDLTVFGVPAYVSSSLGYIGSSTLALSQSISSNMGGYFTSELSLGARLGGWAIDARVTNLGDASGDTFNYGNPFLLGRVEVSTPQRPITASVQVTRSF